MYFCCYVYVFLLLCMLCTVYSVLVVPTGTLRLPWLRVFSAFSSVVRQMPGYNSQRQGMARTLPELIVLFCLLFMCKCVLYWPVWRVCVCVCAHTPHRSYYAAIALTTSERRPYQHWTNLVILAKHWLWLPDDGFFVNWNMLEQPL